MAIRKSMEERVCVDGLRDDWLEKIKVTLETTGFKKISVNNVLFQVSADYRKFSVVGEILVTLTPSTGGNDKTDILIKSTANVDNIYALIKSPNKTIIEVFKSGLGKILK